MATSPLFGWEEPDDVDLVKDGAAAIRTLGNAIDTSMGDLLGGTTGQVLSKASNTNMDFTWVTSDDANAIQNTIVDAKGDLIAASASDTPARLAVGANTAPLVADSTQSTGLRWDNDAWTSYTPVWAATTTNPTLGNGTLTGFYKQRGKIIDVRILLVAGSTSTFGSGGYLFSLPFNASNLNIGGVISHGYVLDASAGTYYHIFCDTAGAVNQISSRTIVTNATWGTMDNLTNAAPVTFANGDSINISFSYEVA